MSKKSYHLTLKGYVGGWDFNRSDVDDILAKNANNHVDILIDSLGGSLATGLSISAAFKNHGDVAVHFVGLNASAATIASLGAAHISMDAGAMYLVHKCSQMFFEWASLNADQFSQLIADCEKIKSDLDKLDINVARLYAARCKKTPEQMLSLMKMGGWLTSQEAKEWGFVDEITDIAEEAAPVMTDALASAMAAEGMPIPNIALSERDSNSPFGRFLSAISSLFKTGSNDISSSVNYMDKTYSKICALLGCSALTLSDNSAALSDDQLTAIENRLSELENTVAERDASITELQGRLDAMPGDTTSQVVEDSKKKSDQNPDEVSDFISTGVSAAKLFNSLP